MKGYLGNPSPILNRAMEWTRKKEEKKINQIQYRKAQLRKKSMSEELIVISQ